jgi:hypothetical protein
MYYHKDKLDIEIEAMREILMKVPQKRQIKVSRKQGSNLKKVTKEDCNNKANGALQHKIWKSGEFQSATKR